MTTILPIASLDQVTKKWIQEVLRQYFDKELHVVEIIKKCPSIRQGFLSEVAFLDVIVKEMEKISLVVKVTPVNEGMKAIVINCSLGKAESEFYKVMNRPEFKANLATLKVIPPLPTVLYCDMVNEDFTLVMEDLSLGNNNLKSPSVGYNADLELTKCAFEAIAIVHAVGYAFIEKYGVSELDVLNSNIAKLPLNDLIKTGLELAVAHTNILDKKILESLNNFLTSNNYSSITKNLESNLPHTIIHGDYWIGQIMFNKIMGKVCVLDWQFAVVSNPIYDLVSFLIVSSDPLVYRNHLEDAIKSYVMKLDEYLGKLKCSVKISHNEVLLEVNKVWHKGFLLLFASLDSLLEVKNITIDKLDDVIKFGFEKGLYKY